MSRRLHLKANYFDSIRGLWSKKHSRLKRTRLVLLRLLMQVFFRFYFEMYVNVKQLLAVCLEKPTADYTNEGLCVRPLSHSNRLPSNRSRHRFGCEIDFVFLSSQKQNQMSLVVCDDRAVALRIFVGQEIPFFWMQRRLANESWAEKMKTHQLTEFGGILFWPVWSCSEWTVNRSCCSCHLNFLHVCWSN